MISLSQCEMVPFDPDGLRTVTGHGPGLPRKRLAAPAAPTSWFSAQMALGTLPTLLGQRQNWERGVQETAGTLWAPVSAPGHPEPGPGSLGWGAPRAHAYRSPAGLARPRAHTCWWKQDGSEPVAPCPGTGHSGLRAAPELQVVFLYGSGRSDSDLRTPEGGRSGCLTPECRAANLCTAYRQPWCLPGHGPAEALRVQAPGGHLGTWGRRHPGPNPSPASVESRVSRAALL